MSQVRIDIPEPSQPPPPPTQPSMFLMVLAYAFAYLVMQTRRFLIVLKRHLNSRYERVLQTYHHLTTAGPPTVAGEWIREIWLFMAHEGALEGSVNLTVVLGLSAALFMYHMQVSLTPPGGFYSATKTEGRRTVQRAGRSIANFEFPEEMDIINKCSNVGLTLNFIVLVSSIAHYNTRRRVTSLLMLGCLFASMCLVLYSHKQVLFIAFGDLDSHQEMSRVVAVSWFDWNARICFGISGLIVIRYIWRM